MIKVDVMFAFHDQTTSYPSPIHDVEREEMIAFYAMLARKEQDYEEIFVILVSSFGNAGIKDDDGKIIKIDRQGDAKAPETRR